MLWIGVVLYGLCNTDLVDHVREPESSVVAKGIHRPFFLDQRKVEAPVPGPMGTKYSMLITSASNGTAGPMMSVVLGSFIVKDALV